MVDGVKKFNDLIVWQKAHSLALGVYSFTMTFPDHEKYCLISQLRRSAVSVPANIVEGFKKRGKADKIRFYNIAQGSLEETRYYFILAKDLGYGNSDSLMLLLEEVSKLLEVYISRINNNSGF
ncbi:MAG: four helix bundle protein [Elusimicrobiota bacterium]